MRSNIVLKIQSKLSDLNSSERIFALKFIMDEKYGLVEKYNSIFIQTPDGNLFPFFDFIKKNCNCGN